MSFISSLSSNDDYRKLGLHPLLHKALTNTFIHRNIKHRAVIDLKIIHQDDKSLKSTNKNNPMKNVE